jgi:hypothetical protein
MRRTILTAASLLAFSGFVLVAANHTSAANNNTGTWKGYVTDTWCGVNRDTKVPTSQCTKDCLKTKNAKLAFYSLEDKNVYLLNPQDMAAKYAGELVTVTGTIGTDVTPITTMRGPSEGKTITVVSIAKAQ